MRQLVEDYIKAKAQAFAPSTLRSERARLLAVADQLEAGPELLYNAIKDKYKPYSLSTLFTRIGAFYEWLIEAGRHAGPNSYKRWKRDHARLFKHAYQRKWPEQSFASTVQQLNLIPDEAVRAAALDMIYNGLRISELAVASGGQTVGKGGKPRPTLASRHTVSYHRLYRALKKLGLTPHGLRKIAATHYRANGLSDEEMCQLFGWEKFETARSYLAPTATEDLLEKVKTIGQS